MKRSSKKQLGKGIAALIEPIEKPGFIEMPYPRDASMLDIFAMIGLAFGFIAMGMALRG